MLPQRAVPIVVGVGSIKNRSQKVEDAIEPMKLMLQATRAAIQDTNLSPRKSSELQSGIDSVGVVNTWTWSYADLPGLISEHLGVRPRYANLSHHGGDSPAKLLDEAARKISFRECRVAVITGGEALASLGACAAAGHSPPGWTPPEKGGKSLSVGDISRMPESIGTLHSIGLPSLQGNDKEPAELYADFAKVAEKNPLAWNYGQPAATEDSIGIVSKKNRMICFSYPLLMNAFNSINLAGSCILTSTEYAQELGISESKWIHPLGGAGSSDVENSWERPNFYSCFPTVPKLACRHLGFPLTKQSKPITLLGGLTSFGGAGNNYSIHALTEMVRVLRKGESK